MGRTLGAGPLAHISTQPPPERFNYCRPKPTLYYENSFFVEGMLLRSCEHSLIEYLDNVK
jgi:hypothetical protein